MKITEIPKHVANEIYRIKRNYVNKLKKNQLMLIFKKDVLVVLNRFFFLENHKTKFVYEKY